MSIVSPTPNPTIIEPTLVVANRAFAPAEQSAIPLVVPPENLLTANALFATTNVGSIIVGFGVGETMLTAVTQINKHGSQEILVASFYLMAACLGQCVKIRETSHITKYQRKINPWNEIKDGFEYLQSNKLLLSAMLQIAVLSAAIAALPILAISLTEQVGLAVKQFGFLVAPAGIGLVFGAGMLGHFGQRLQQKSLPLVGFIIMSIVLAIFTFVSNLWVGLFCAGILGFGAALIQVPMQTLIQERTPESMRGKVFGFQNNLTNIAVAIPLFVTGPLTEQFGLQPVLWGMSAVIAIAGILTWRSTRHVLEDVL